MRVISIVFILAALSACHKTTASRDEQDRNSVAFKAGEAANHLSKNIGKAAKAAGKEIGKDAHEMREGWKQAQHDDREKKRTER